MTEHMLVTLGKKRFLNPDRTSVELVQDKVQNDFLNDLERNPHAFVLACLMDRQIPAERAWSIPFKIKEIVGSFDIDELGKVTLEEYKTIFTSNSLHRFNDMMADIFLSAIKDIQQKYGGDASRIWSNEPCSAKVVYEFLQFKGGGIKIATMAANILARQFKIPFSDHYSIDISPDVHVMRVMRRTGLIGPDSDLESVIYKARELNPEFPGVIDFSCWEIGRTWCKPNNPNCMECLIESECQKVI